MQIYNNPTFTFGELCLIEQKIKNNIYDVNDLKLLNDCLSGIGVNNFLLEKLCENGIYSFEEFIIRANGNDKGMSIISNFKGNILGVIDILKLKIK